MISLFRLFIVCILLFTNSVTYAFERSFPLHAQRGILSTGVYPNVLINQKLRQLSVGVRIWNTDNLIELPAYLQKTKVLVNYTENTQNEIDRIWILTEEEINANPESPKLDELPIHLIQ